MSALFIAIVLTVVLWVAALVADAWERRADR